jgi:hypothetical protein
MRQIRCAAALAAGVFALAGGPALAVVVDVDVMSEGEPISEAEISFETLEGDPIEFSEVAEPEDVAPPTEEVAEAPAEEVVEPPAEEVAEPPAEDVAEPPVEEPVEEPVEGVAEAPAEEVAEEPAEEVAETPAEEAAEEPAEEVAEAPAEEPAEEVVETPVDAAEEVVEEPGEQVAEEPDDDDDRIAALVLLSQTDEDGGVTAEISDEFRGQTIVVVVKKDDQEERRRVALVLPVNSVTVDLPAAAAGFAETAAAAEQGAGDGLIPGLDLYFGPAFGIMGGHSEVHVSQDVAGVTTNVQGGGTGVSGFAGLEIWAAADLSELADVPTVGGLSPTIGFWATGGAYGIGGETTDRRSLDAANPIDPDTHITSGGEGFGLGFAPVIGLAGDNFNASVLAGMMKYIGSADSQFELCEIIRPRSGVGSTMPMVRKPNAPSAVM